MNTTTLNMTTLDGGNVIIKKGEGGGSMPPSGEESASTIEYLDVSGLELKIRGPLWQMAYIKKGYSAINGFDIIAAMWPQVSESDVDKAVMLSFSDIVMAMNGTSFTIPQYCAQLGITQEQLDAIPRITKEEFYSLD